MPDNFAAGSKSRPNFGSMTAFFSSFPFKRCVEKIDPCNPSPCGPGTTCETNYAGSAICKCIGDLIPKPDTITGCGPECEVKI